MTLIISEHAVERARQRYGLANVDWELIHRDVSEGLLAGRGGTAHPNGSGYVCLRGGIYVWTACQKRLYVVEAFRRGRRTHLRVLTALPGFYGSEHTVSRWRLAA